MKTNQIIIVSILILTIASRHLLASPRYVWKDSPNSSPPYTNWATAAHTIQEAVDVAEAGDLVFVTNGIYADGGRAVYGLMTNRVVINKPITVKSMNGPSVTFIVGAASPSGNESGNGDGAIRCVWIGNGATLSGFTITNGHTRGVSGDIEKEREGGGIWCADTNSIVTNCIFIKNSADWAGGGAFAYYGAHFYNCIFINNTAGSGGGAILGGVFFNCIITSNSAKTDGGGAYWGIFYNCELTKNSAIYGGGAYYSTFYNCTIAANSAAYYGGGAWGSTLYNSILYYNIAPNNQNYVGCNLNYSCTTPLPSEGSNNITSEPGFVDLKNSNFHLVAGSPCIDAGSNDYVQPNATDLEGKPRILGTHVDIGAYEWINPAMDTDSDGMPDFWEWKYGLDLNNPADSNLDNDGDGLNNLQEFFADTAPNDPQDVLKLTPLLISPDIIVIKFLAKSNHSYSIQQRAKIAIGSWQNLVDLWATPTNRWIFITNYIDSPSKYYRVSILPFQ